MLHCSKAILCPLPRIHNPELKVYINCCCYFFVVFFYVILFYFLLVISCNNIQRANKVVDCSIYSVAPIDSWLFSVATYWNASRTKRADLQQICNRSILTKTDQLQTNLSSAESVLSLLQTLSLNTLRVVMPADEKQTTTDLQIICSVCR